MKAALFEDIGKLKLIETDPPEIDGADEILIRIGAVGICGSEIHAFQGTHPFRKPPAIMGHEVAGDVVAVGESVKNFSLGDRVCVDPQWFCGTCEWCQSGRHNLCRNKKVLGTIGWTGGLGEYIVAPEMSVYALPDHMSYVKGTLVEPLSVGAHAVARSGIKEGESVVVVGSGPIGMMVSGAASVRGASPIVAVDLQEHCLTMAKQHFGATHTLNGRDGSIAERVLELTDGRGVDVVFMTVGVAPLVDEALRMVARGGRITLVALFEDPITFEPFDIVGRDVSFVGCQMYDATDIQTAIDWIASDRVTVEAMVTHRLPFEDAQRGFDLAATKEDNAVKAVLIYDWES